MFVSSAVFMLTLFGFSHGIPPESWPIPTSFNDHGGNYYFIYKYKFTDVPFVP